MKRFLDYLRLFGVAGVVIAIDQWTKMLVRTHINYEQAWLPDNLLWLMPYARLMNWHNSGAAFGSFPGLSWIFSILAFAVAGLIIYYYPRVDSADWWLKLAMGMQMGGALGNVIDRLTQNGEVTDFISVSTFPVFNVADASISVGVAILLLGMWIKERADSKRASAQAGATTENQPADEPGESTGG